MTEANHIDLVGGLEHFLFSIIYGMSSFPLTFIFFRGVGQPPTSDFTTNKSTSDMGES